MSLRVLKEPGLAVWASYLVNNDLAVMSTQQPQWKLVANLGDVNPVDYGGLFVYVDETGVYVPEMERLDSPDSDDGEWIIHRCVLERCTFIDGILSDNEYHPNLLAWFADDIGSVAEFADMADIVAML